MKNKILRYTGATSILLIILICGCDPEKIVNEYFAKAGLTRLATLRDDIQPGGLILVGSHGAVYADNMFDYTNGVGNVSTSNEDKTTEFNAIMRKYTNSRSMSASAAVSFLQSLLPVPIDLSGSLGLTNNVTIELINADVCRMKIPDIQIFLGRPESLPFRKYVRSQDTKAYLIYEIWRSNKLKITADTGKDVSASVNVGTNQILSSGKLSLTYQRVSQSEIDITGTNLYVFAVRTARLVPDGDAPDSLKFEVTHFLYPGDWGIMGAGQDIQYSAPISEGEAIKLVDKPMMKP